MNNKLDTPLKLGPPKNSQRRIGLTGGIGSGKSSISQFLQEDKKLPVLDSDIYAKEALGPDTDATKSVFQRYGDLIKDESSDNTLKINRSLLGKIIFNNKEERLWLEKILHPLITKRLIREMDIKTKEPIIVIVVPLLFEIELTGLCNEIWVVNCTPEQQCERIMKRDNLSLNDSLKRINAQIPLRDKIGLADFVIDNSKNLNHAIRQVDNYVKKSIPEVS